MFDPKHPMQPLVTDPSGVIRFKGNAIVRHLLDVVREHKLADLNSLACKDFTKDDWTQFMQLIGYSVSGFGELTDHVDPEVIAEADRLAEEMGTAG